ncbi:CDGSH iron-sulfur domain-containing protein [Arthrobacter caoxuetaonis]|uniref:CDGSH iron-sulfur domain-containing protein n=1 Tax=Arthrobacter caoxuetaonis TaxID=2886935 RepID=UPI00311A9247
MSAAPSGPAATIPAATIKSTGIRVVAAGDSADPDAVSLTSCPGGPLLVRGDFEVQADDGTVIPKNRETVALCRCTGSKIKPWCDGTHKLLKRPAAEAEE